MTRPSRKSTPRILPTATSLDLHSGNQDSLKSPPAPSAGTSICIDCSLMMIDLPGFIIVFLFFNLQIEILLFYANCSRLPSTLFLEIPRGQCRPGHLLQRAGGDGI